MGTEITRANVIIGIVCRVRRNEDPGDTVKACQHIRAQKKEPKRKQKEQ